MQLTVGLQKCDYFASEDQWPAVPRSEASPNRKCTVTSAGLNIPAVALRMDSYQLSAFLW